MGDYKRGNRGAVKGEGRGREGRQGSRTLSFYVIVESPVILALGSEPGGVCGS